MSKLARSAQLAAALGGLLWLVKALVITARDGSFDPLESVFFIGGLLALVAATVLWAAYAARRFRGAARVAVAIAGVPVLIAGTLLVELVGKTLVGGLAPGGNLGLEEEGGILLAGLAWLAVGLVAGSRSPAAARPLPTRG
jgi:hypothetical protein